MTAFPTLGGEWQRQGAQSLLVKPVGTEDLLRQIEALLINHEDEKQRDRKAATRANLASASARKAV